LQLDKKDKKMPNLETHIEVSKPIIGGGSSFIAGMLLEYLNVTTPIFAAASFGAIMAVMMLGKFKPLEAFGTIIPPTAVAILVSLTGGIAACYGFSLIEPLSGFKLDQAPATAFLAFILVYFFPKILEVINSKLDGLK
jgi:hypothetical protein